MSTGSGKVIFGVGDSVEFGGVAGKVTGTFTNDDGIACVTVELENEESVNFLADGRLDSFHKKSLLVLLSKAAVKKTLFFNIYKTAEGDIKMGSKRFESEALAKAKGANTTGYVGTSSAVIGG